MKEYKYFSDEEQRDFESACYQTAHLIEDIVHYLQKEFRLKNMDSKYEDPIALTKLRTEHNYLKTLSNRINSEAEKLKETNNG